MGEMGVLFSLIGIWIAARILGSLLVEYSPEYGILQWKGDIQQFAKAMQLVDTPDKMQKHSQLKQAIHNLERSKKKGIDRINNHVKEINI
ncbi:hypothetical protein F4815DRAFT_465789 [Daldinia loculata]|nr:hypothetical protein F4815DRAFT_465789 [Daldinia loculata]